MLDMQAVQEKWQWRNYARPEQLEPDDYLMWLIETGRGWGKTRTGAETVTNKIQYEGVRRVALVAPTASDARDTMVDELMENSGLLTVAPPWFTPKYEPSKRRLVYPNGAVCRIFSSEEPDRLRGPQHELAWCDELAAWKRHNVDQAWSNLMFGLRQGKAQVIVTTTPKPILLLRKLHKRAVEEPDSKIVITNGSTFDNEANLSNAYIETVVNPYKGTRVGEQELYGKLLEDNPDALWTYDDFERNRTTKVPEPILSKGIAVDPTGSDEGHECGIIGGALAGDFDSTKCDGYVLGDWSMRGTPDQWAARVIEAYDEIDADFVAVETNYGGQMVATVLRLKCRDLGHKPLNIIEVNATRGKVVRAEPISGLYQQDRIHHVTPTGQELEVLENQMTAFTMGDANDRVDANVWLWTHLLSNAVPRLGPGRALDQAYEKLIASRSERTPVTTMGSLWRKQF